MSNGNRRIAPGKQVRRPDADIRKRQNQRRKKKRWQIMRNRAIVAASLGVIVIVILMFFTPLFNIQGIEISGNEAVSTSEIDAAIGTVTGANIFTVKLGDLESKIESVAYIANADVSRKIIPRTLVVSVTESLPSGYFKNGDSYVVIDENCNVLSQESSAPKNIPQITGFTGYTSGEKLPDENKEKTEAASEFMKSMNELGLLKKVNILSLDPITSITFTYDNRLEVLCGSALDMDLKLKMFKENIYSSVLTDKSRGTIDLSVTGKAVYAP